MSFPGTHPIDCEHTEPGVLKKRVELPHSCGRTIRMAPNPRGNSKKIRPCLNQRQRVLDSYAADRHAWHGHHLRPPAEQVDVSTRLRVFGRSRKERTERKI